MADINWGMYTWVTYASHYLIRWCVSTGFAQVSLFNGSWKCVCDRGVSVKTMRKQIKWPAFWKRHNAPEERRGKDTAYSCPILCWQSCRSSEAPNPIASLNYSDVTFRIPNAVTKASLPISNKQWTKWVSFYIRIQCDYRRWLQRLTALDLYISYSLAIANRTFCSGGA